MAEGSNYDYLFKVHSMLSSFIVFPNLSTKVVLIGDSGVGKSYVFHQICCI